MPKGRGTRVLVTALVVLFACSSKTDSLPATPRSPSPAQAEPLKVFVFTKTAGFRHDSIAAGIEALKELGSGKYDVESGESLPSELSQFRALVFLNTTGDVLDDSQQRAFEKFVRDGGGFVGIHSATDTEYDWPFYGELVGAYFADHPAIQKGNIRVEDRTHPATRDLPETWERTDEWYNFRANPRGKVYVLMTLDEQSYQGGKMGGDHPLAWCHLVGKGRSFYTAGGHTIESFSEPLFREHLRGGISWAAGTATADCGS